MAELEHVSKVVDSTRLPFDQRKPAEPQNVLAVISQLAANPNVNPENVSKWLEMYERLDARHREKSFKEALARLQADLPQIERNGVIQFHSGGGIRYAKLEDIDKVIRPMLEKEGFAFSFGSQSQDGKLFEITATLSHREGHSKEYRIQLPIDTHKSRNDVQAVGSTLSYAKRMLIKMALNIIEKGEDDDGKGGVISEEQVKDLASLIAEVGKVDMPRFLKFMGVEKLEDIAASDYQRAIVALEQKRRAGK